MSSSGAPSLTEDKLSSSQTGVSRSDERASNPSQLVLAAVAAMLIGFLGFLCGLSLQTGVVATGGVQSRVARYSTLPNEDEAEREIARLSTGTDDTEAAQEVVASATAKIREVNAEASREIDLLREDAATSLDKLLPHTPRKQRMDILRLAFGDR